MTQETISTSIVAALATGIVGYLLAYLKHFAVNKVNAYDEKERVFNQLLDNYQKTVERQDKIVAHLEQLDKKMNDLEDKMANIAGGGLAILKDRIIQSCRYFIERGSIPLAEKTNIQDMYHYYHDIFGGNGTGQYYFELMMKLPVDASPIVSAVHFDERIIHGTDESK